MKKYDVNQSPQSAIRNLFGLYKAEWHDGQLFDHFTEPDYFRDLASRRPCVLIGGRGTGKTTVLRGLSFEGQYKMAGSKGIPLEGVPYIGLYYRVNTNRVMAFTGPEASEEQWEKYFGHYMNLTLVGLLVDFLSWYERQTSIQLDLASKGLAKVATALHLPESKDLPSLAEALDQARVKFESEINNIAAEVRPRVSLLGAPIDELVSATLALDEFDAKQVFFLLDEYENFQEYQQRVVNTLIKQASGPYVFKIGVRELGWRERATLNRHEQLTDPADYVRIPLREVLTDERFRRFASKVCNSRLALVQEQHADIIDSVEEMLPGLSEEEEARLLGVEEAANEILKNLQRSGHPELARSANRLQPLELYFARFWAEAHGSDVADVLEEREQAPEEWRTRMGNYGHAALFTLKRGRRGIRKYYAGWNCFTQLAHGNIRYLLQLVHASYGKHFEGDSPASQAIGASEQTRAAQQVGKGNLDELEGLSVEGARLTKLLLGLGRILQVLAEQAEGHTPEVTQFQLVEGGASVSEDSAEKADKLLRLAVMHQALVRFKGTKPIDESDTREYDYMAHPIFAAFFGFSHRRKRKLRIKTQQLLGLVDSHRSAIREILAGQNRYDEGELPDQLRLFEGYFDAR